MKMFFLVNVKESKKMNSLKLAFTSACGKRNEDRVSKKMREREEEKF